MCVCVCVCVLLWCEISALVCLADRRYPSGFCINVALEHSLRRLVRFDPLLHLCAQAPSYLRNITKLQH
jgi:hypothetical protein